jgi:hypothetical protein
VRTIVVVLIGLAISACRPPATAPAPVAETPITSPPPPVMDPTPPPSDPAPRIGPFHRDAPILFTPSDTPAVVEPVTKAVRGWASSRDGIVRAEIGCKKDVRVIDGTGTRKIAKQADRVVVSPDGADVALERGGQVHFRDAATAGTEAVFLHGGVLAFRRACTWHTGVDAAVIGEGCGAPILVERERPRMWLAELEPKTAGPDGRERQLARALVGLEPGRPPIRIELAAEGRMFAPVLSADATILCATFDDRGHDVLECRLREGGPFERVARDVSGPPMFADDAPRMVFTVGDPTHPPRDLHLADFTQGTIRKVGRVAHHRLEFLPGGEHVVAYDGARGLVFELDTGLVTPFGEESDDWVALAGDGNAGSFFASRLRRQCAELVRVRLPARDGGTSATAEN